jgi:hypothetical protein
MGDGIPLAWERDSEARKQNNSHKDSTNQCPSTGSISDQQWVWSVGMRRKRRPSPGFPCLVTKTGGVDNSKAMGFRAGALCLLSLPLQFSDALSSLKGSQASERKVSSPGNFWRTTQGKWCRSEALSDVSQRSNWEHQGGYTELGLGRRWMCQDGGWARAFWCEWGFVKEDFSAPSPMCCWDTLVYPWVGQLFPGLLYEEEHQPQILFLPLLALSVLLHSLHLNAPILWQPLPPRSAAGSQWGNSVKCLGHCLAHKSTHKG